MNPNAAAAAVSARPPNPGPGSLDQAISRGRDALLGLQKPDGHWVFELEADCTIPAEYILMMHYMDEIDVALEGRIAKFLRAKQADHGGWPLYEGGDLDLSCTIKVYYALKIVGDDVDAPHMVRAREAIHARGGAAKANVFTRIALALFGQVPWRAVPFVPVEVMFLPRWFPFHLDKVSYWSRTVMVPLFILCARKPRAKNPRQVNVRELFVVPPEEERNYYSVKGWMGRVFLVLDRIGRRFEPMIPSTVRERAIRRAEAWFVERLNGEDGLGAIFPAMVNAYEAMALLGYPADHPLRATCKRAIDKLLVERPDGSTYCQPCVSPVWDTAFCALTLHKMDDEPATLTAVQGALAWLKSKQVLDLRGDWIARRPDVAPGGWAFQYANPHYPDLDDTAVVAGILQIAGDPAQYGEAVTRATDWLVALQSENGGFAAFDADNCFYYLNYIPFADHGALLDPPTADVTGRVLTLLGILKRAQDKEVIRRGIEYLKKEQEPEGCWWGRWGTNYIYGTWSALVGLVYAGEDPSQPYIARAIAWLESKQHEDGGWGETNDTYADRSLMGELPESTAYSAAWAVLALLVAGQARSEATRRGIAYLLREQQADGLWYHRTFTAPGFPRVFYLKYHGYTAYFPLWALARYRNLTALRPVR